MASPTRPAVAATALRAAVAAEDNARRRLAVAEKELARRSAQFKREAPESDEAEARLYPWLKQSQLEVKRLRAEVDAASRESETAMGLVSLTAPPARTRVGREAEALIQGVPRPRRSRERGMTSVGAMGAAAGGAALLAILLSPALREKIKSGLRRVFFAS